MSEYMPTSHQCSDCGYPIDTDVSCKCPECGGTNVCLNRYRPRLWRRMRYPVVYVTAAFIAVLQVAQFLFALFSTMPGRTYSIGWPVAFWTGEHRLFNSSYSRFDFSALVMSVLLWMMIVVVAWCVDHALRAMAARYVA